MICVLCIKHLVPSMFLLVFKQARKKKKNSSQLAESLQNIAGGERNKHIFAFLDLLKAVGIHINSPNWWFNGDLPW